MAITGLKTWTDADLVTTANLNVNTTVLEAKFNQGLTTADSSATAGYTNAQLANSIYEFTLQLDVKPTTAVQPPTSATIPIAIAMLPGTTNDGIAYTIISGAYAMVDTGTAGTSTFHYELGFYSAGTWTPFGSDLTADINVSALGAGLGASSAIPFTTTAITLNASTQYGIGLMLTAIGTNSLNEAHQGLFSTIKLKRTAGLRG